MKYILTVLFALISLKSLAQALTITEVVTVDSSVSEKELFSRARAWFNETYKSSKHVLQIEDRESGQLAGKANFNYYSRYFMGSGATKGNINYSVKIYVKQGRYKYVFTDFIHEASITNEHPHSMGLITTDSTQDMGLMGKKFELKVWKELTEKSTTHAQLLAEDLKAYMNKPSENADDSW